MNEKIVIKRNPDGSIFTHVHTKGLETYLYVTFKYDGDDFECYLPIEDRRKGIDFDVSSGIGDDLKIYLNQCYENLSKIKRDSWNSEHPIASPKKRSDEILDFLNDFKLHPMADFKKVSNNTNPQKTIQLLKDNGITIVTIMTSCKAHCQLIPLPDTVSFL